MLRGLERAALADPGARLLARGAPDAVAAAAPHIGELLERIGARAQLGADPSLAADQFEIETR